MSSEAIVCTVVLICVVLILFLVQRKNKAKAVEKTKDSSESTAGDESGKTSGPGGAASKIESSEKKGEEKRSGLLYIPPEMVSHENKSDGYTDDTYERTEVREISGVHEIYSDSASDRVDIAGESTVRTRSPGTSSGYNPDDQSSASVSNSEDNENNTVRIYQYRKKTNKWVCPYCKLENPGWTNICQVCGEIRTNVKNAR